MNTTPMFSVAGILAFLFLLPWAWGCGDESEYNAVRLEGEFCRVSAQCIHGLKCLEFICRTPRECPQHKNCLDYECGFDPMCREPCGQCDDSHFCQYGKCVDLAILPSDLRWLSVPAGSFKMGCSPQDKTCHDSEKPVREVSVSAFEMLETEITEGQYQFVMGTNPSSSKKGENYPLENISWHDAQGFCHRIGGRLPTEAEWEYAARGGTDTVYHCGQEASCLNHTSWHQQNSNNSKQEVKQKTPNAYGLYDMFGNVWEWTEDCWHNNYKGAPLTSWPSWMENCSGSLQYLLNVSRGGSFSSLAEKDLRASHRDHSYGPNGFRCVRDVLQKQPTPPRHAIWKDPASGLTWQRIPTGGTKHWAEAKKHCESLDIDGITHWRLPSIKELRSLIRGCPATETGGTCNVEEAICLAPNCTDNSCRGCSINQGPAAGCYWPQEIQGECSSYWSLSPSEELGGGAWRVNFLSGDIYNSVLNFDRHVRCVR